MPPRYDEEHFHKLYMIVLGKSALITVEIIPFLLSKKRKIEKNDF